MVRKAVLAPLLVVAALLLSLALSFSIRQCRAVDSSAGAPRAAFRDDRGFCLPVTRNVMRGLFFVLGFLEALACIVAFNLFASSAADEASGTAKVAACVDIGDELEAGPGAGGDEYN